MRRRGVGSGPIRLRDGYKGSGFKGLAVKGAGFKDAGHEGNGFRKRQSRTQIVLAGMIIASCAASMGFASVGANIVSSDIVTTRFSIASPSQLSLKVIEEWDCSDQDNDGIADCAQGLLPGDTLARTVRLANLSETDCYAIAQIGIPATNVDGLMVPLLSFDAGTSWRLWGKPVLIEGENKLVWTYLLREKLAPHRESDAIFEEMRVQKTSNTQIPASTGDMQVVGYAISTDGYENADTAWQAYISSGGLGEEVQWLSFPETSQTGGEGYDLEFF